MREDIAQRRRAGPTGPNVQIIDPSQGQSCTSAPGAPATEESITWNSAGQPGAPGPVGPQGPGGPAGAAGPSGPAGHTITINGETFTISGLKATGTVANVLPPPAANPKGRSVGQLTLGSGRRATTFNVLGWGATGGARATAGRAGRPATGELLITKLVDKSSPNLLKACASGKHFHRAYLTLRKAGENPLEVTLTDALISSYPRRARRASRPRPCRSPSPRSSTATPPPSDLHAVLVARHGSSRTPLGAGGVPAADRRVREAVAARPAGGCVDNRAIERAMTATAEAIPGAQRTAIASLAAAFVLVALKLGTGLATGSLAFVSAGVESSGDVIAALLTLGAIRIAGRPADREHNYGHRRAENIAALGESGIVFVGGCIIAVEAIKRLVNGGGDLHASWYLFAVIGIALCIDITRIVISLRAARRYGSAAFAPMRSISPVTRSARSPYSRACCS